MSTHNSVFHMPYFVSMGITALVLGAVQLAIIPATTAWLEDATKKQCLAHAWPAANTATMLNWCEHNGYDTKHGLAGYAFRAVTAK